MTSDRDTDTPELAAIVRRNIRAMLLARESFDRQKTTDERVASRFTTFLGSMPFVYTQAAFTLTWVVVNLGLVPFIRPWDRFPFPLLAGGASLEGIFLATLVLLNQRHMQQVADRRADLDLQVNLLAEREITRVLGIVDAIAQHVGATIPRDEEHDCLKNDVAPEQVLREIERAEEEVEKIEDLGRAT